ncbi:MAG: glycoside hydrolase family 88 protein [Candidatus Eisenbacteria bacterium]
MTSESPTPRRSILVAAVAALILLVLQVPTSGALDEPARDSAPSGGAYPHVSEDAAWTWFGGPRAVTYEGRHRRTYTGWISSRGEVRVASIDDDGVVAETLWTGQDPDDHSNPSILVLPDGRLMVFCSPHRWRRTTGRRERADGGILYRVSVRPEDVSEWEPSRMIEDNVSGGFGWTYPKPFRLSGEDDRIYLFWRGGNGRPVLAFSDDGVKWDLSGVFVETGGKRPYLVVASDDVDEMHVAFTRGHPDEESENGVYYLKYRDGSLYRADGTRICGLDELPVTPEECDVVYDGVSSGPGWVWDVAFDDEGAPVIVYAVFPGLDDHRYRYARWRDGTWRTTELTGAGSAFPRPGFGVERERYYSGGITLDHDDPDIVYLSRPVSEVFELERWVTGDGGDTWSAEALTSGSTVDNVRPVVPLHRSPGDPRLIWMSGIYYRYDLFGTGLRYAPGAADAGSLPLRALPPREEIVSLAAHVCDAELAAHVPRTLFKQEWCEAVFYMGVLAAHDLTGEERFLEAARDWSEGRDWQLGPRPRHADDLSPAQVYVGLWNLERGDEASQPSGGALAATDAALGSMLEPTIAAFDAMLAEPLPGRDEWSWCDALFMAPPAMARLSEATGDERYVDAMDAMWWDVVDHLYDADRHLFYRDARRKPRSVPGAAPGLAAPFWGRGNGWVMAGTTRVLDALPPDHPSRARYETLLSDMAAAVAEVQGADGLWRPDLLRSRLHPDPDTSGSSLICCAIAWGIAEGVLPAEPHAPVVAAAWEGLTRAVDESGRLGWVQPIGAAPGAVGAQDHADYGTGAFLMAAREVARLSARFPAQDPLNPR